MAPDTDTDRDDLGLDTFFAEARQATPPSQDLVARVLADAAAQQDLQHTEPLVPAPVRQRSWIGNAISAIGGWPGVSGVTLAGVTGLMLGLYAPDIVDTWSGGQLSTLTGGSVATPDLTALWVEDSDV